MAYINEGRPIYITYARNDEKHPGWEHISDIKDTIVKALRDNNIDVYDDDGDIKAGDSITEFEKEIGASEFTILVFSDKYFHSHHCMYEFAEIKKAVDERKKRKLICIKSGNCKLDDPNYIEGLRDYWADYAAEKTKIKFKKTRNLTPIEGAAETNGYYADYIGDLYTFFSNQKYLNADNLNIDSLVNDFKSLFEEQYHLCIEGKQEGPFGLRVMKRKLRLMSKDTLVWKQGMATWVKAIDIPELRAVFPIVPPPIPTIISPSQYNSKPSNVGHNIIIEEPYPFKMIFVPGGTFQMGSNEYDDEKPIHSVTLSDYYLGETQVTQGLWKAVMGDNPSKFKKGDDYPVECVSWNDIVKDFLPRLNKMTGKNFRLPTEAEWEFAARGGNKHSPYKYSGSDKLSDVAWYGWADDADKNRTIKKQTTMPVAQKKPNDLGIYDMSGNVWEWCQDLYKEDHYKESPSTDPQGPSSGSSRVLRGGSWSSCAGDCRVSYRSNFSPDGRNDGFGLRLALVVP